MAKLIIDKQFDKDVWQTETEFDNKKYNEWLQNAKEVLIKARDIIDDDIDCGNIEYFDTNILGDLINMLDVIKVEKDEPRGEAWTVTAEDFTERYDCSGIDEDQMAKMIEHVAHGMVNNDCMADCYWMSIDMEAEDNGLLRLYEPYLHDDKIVEYVSQHADICQHEATRALDSMEQYRWPLSHASRELYDRLDECINTWLEDNEIATDENHWPDVEDIFCKVEKWEPED